MMNGKINLFLFLFMSFGHPTNANEPLDRIDLYSNQLCSELGKIGIKAFGSGGSKSNYEVRYVDLDFKYDIQADIMKARNLLVSIIERYLERVNSDTIIRPYMHEYPFRPENCGFSILFKEVMDSSADNVSSVRQSKGRLRYSKYVDGKRIVIHTEPYEEALRIYKEQLKSNES